jgi:hypothetical protein
MQLVLIDSVAGIALLATIGLVASRRPRVESRSLRRLGWILVAVPLPSVVALHLSGQLPQTTDQAAFLTAVVAFAVGAALVLSDDEEDWREELESDSPPWWPQFERDFREYSSRPRTRPGAPLTRV